MLRSRIDASSMVDPGNYMSDFSGIVDGVNDLGKAFSGIPQFKELKKQMASNEKFREESGEEFKEFFEQVATDPKAITDFQKNHPDMKDDEIHNMLTQQSAEFQPQGDETPQEYANRTAKLFHSFMAKYPKLGYKTYASMAGLKTMQEEGQGDFRKEIENARDLQHGSSLVDQFRKGGTGNIQELQRQIKEAGLTYSDDMGEEFLSEDMNAAQSALLETMDKYNYPEKEGGDPNYDIAKMSNDKGLIIEELLKGTKNPTNPKVIKRVTDMVNGMIDIQAKQARIEANNKGGGGGTKPTKDKLPEIIKTVESQYADAKDLLKEFDESHNKAKYDKDGQPIGTLSDADRFKRAKLLKAKNDLHIKLEDYRSQRTDNLTSGSDVEEIKKYQAPGTALDKKTNLPMQILPGQEARMNSVSDTFSSDKAFSAFKVASDAALVNVILKQAEIKSGDPGFATLSTYKKKGSLRIAKGSEGTYGIYGTDADGSVLIGSYTPKAPGSKFVTYNQQLALLSGIDVGGVEPYDRHKEHTEAVAGSKEEEASETSAEEEAEAQGTPGAAPTAESMGLDKTDTKKYNAQIQFQKHNGFEVEGTPGVLVNGDSYMVFKDGKFTPVDSKLEAYKQADMLYNSEPAEDATVAPIPKVTPSQQIPSYAHAAPTEEEPAQEEAPEEPQTPSQQIPSYTHAAPNLHGDQSDISALGDVVLKHEHKGWEKQPHAKSEYDATFGNGQFLKLDKPLTEYSVAEVVKLGNEQINASKGKFGSASYKKKNLGTSALGKYQMMGYNIKEYMKAKKIDPSTPFDSKMQDSIAEWLIDNKGKDTLFQDYLNGKVDDKKMIDRIAGLWMSVKDSNGSGTVSGQDKNAKDMLAQLKALKAKRGQQASLRQ